MGRGGMGSHPRNAHFKSKSISQKSQLVVPDIFFLLHRSKTEKKRRRKGKEVLAVSDEPRGFDTARASELSFATISSIHFSGETDGPPPDFFVKRRERKNVCAEDGLSFLSKDLEQEDEQKEKNPSIAAHRFSKPLRNLGDVPTVMSRPALIMDDDQTPATTSNVGTKQNHRHRFSLPVFPTTVVNTTNSKTCDRGSQRMSMSGLPIDKRNRVGDDLSLTTDPDPNGPSFSSCTLRTSRTTAYLGTESRPKTVPLTREFQTSASSLSETEPVNEAPVSPFDESQLYDSESQAIRLQKTDGKSEYSRLLPIPESRVTDSLSTPSPTRRSSEESHRWSGKWNARLPDVIHALRELR